MFFPCLKEILVETECPQKTTTVIPKLGVIKLLYTLNFDLLPAFILICIYRGRQQKQKLCQMLILLSAIKPLKAILLGIAASSGQKTHGKHC